MENNQEGIIETQERLDVNLTEDQVKTILANRIEKGKSFWDAKLNLTKVREDNEKRWMGKNREVAGQRIYDYQTAYEDNRIFVSVETLAASLVPRIPTPEILAAKDTYASRELAVNFEKVLQRKAEDEMLKSKLRMAVRHILMGYRCGILKLSWDFDRGIKGENGKPLGDIKVDYVRPHRIVIDADATDPNDIGLMAENISCTLEDVIRKFPDKKLEIMAKYGKNSADLTLGSPANYWEVWFTYFNDKGEKREGLAWKMEDLILGYGDNPYYNYEEGTSNFLDCAPKPYVFFNFLRIGRWVFDDSVSADTPVIIRRNKKFVDILPIEELTPNYVNNDDGYYEKYRHVAKSIEALNKEGNWCPIDYVYRHKVKKDIYTVVTGSGVAKVTGDHSLFTNFKEVKVSSLKIGDKVDLIPTPFITDNSQFSSEYAFLLGFFAAEGWCGSRKYGNSQDAIHIAQKNPKVLERLQPIIEDYWSRKFEIRKSKDMYSLQLIAGRNGKSSTMVNWFRENFYTRSGEKRIPISILNSNLKTKMAFLEGYWEGDGWGELKNKKPAKCSTKSFVLAAGIGYLLNQVGYEFGVYCRHDKESNFEIKINRSGKKKVLSNQIKEIRKKQNNDFVYDLGIGDESHSFVGGVGFLAFHNTSLTEQAAPLQDILNKRGHQIVDNADQANAVKVFNSEMIDAKDAEKYTGDPNDNLIVTGDVRMAFARVPAPGLPSYVLQDKYDARGEIDNIFGTHAPMRGEGSNSPTLGQEVLSQRADLGRTASLSEAIEEGSTKVYQIMTQLYKVFAKKEHMVKYVGEDGKVNFIRFSKDKVEDGIEIRVKAGSLEPEDKISDKNEAVELAKTGKIIDPLTFAEKWHLEKPIEAAKRSFYYAFAPDKYASEILKIGMEQGVQEALETIGKINNGEFIAGKEDAEPAYLNAYGQFVQSPEFKQLDPEVQKLHVVHLRETSDIVKRNLKEGKSSVPEEENLLSKIVKRITGKY